MIDSEKLRRALLDLRNPDYAIRTAAFQHVTQTGILAVDAFIDFLDDPNLCEVSVDFLWGLYRDHQFAHEQLAPALMKLIISNDNPLMIKDALSFLAQLKDPSTFDFFVGLLYHAEDVLRDGASEALIWFCYAPAAPHLIEAQKIEVRPDIRVQMVHALGSTGDNNAVPVLKDLLSAPPDENPRLNLSLAAKWSLEKIGTPEALAVLKQHELE